MKAKNYELMLDIYKGILNPQNIQFATEDFGMCSLTFSILEDMITPYRLDDCIVRMLINGQQQDCTIIDATNGKVTITLLQSMLKEGQNVAELQIYDALNQTLRITTPTFNYNVRRSLMNDTTLEADPNYSILQSMILEVSNANEVANNAKTVAEGALSTANQAQTKATEIMANGDYAKAQGDYAKAKGDEVANKITLNSLPQTNFNFIENKVVQDGLVGSAFNVLLDGTLKRIQNITLSNNYTIQTSYANVKANNVYLFQVNGYDLMINVVTNVIRIFSVATPLLTTEIPRPNGEKLEFAFVMYNGVLKMLLNNKYYTINYTPTITSANITYSPTQDNSNVTGLLNGCVIYNRALTPAEIQHNFTVLNNSPSINALNVGDKKLLLFGSDEDHVEMATGRTWREEYMSLLKQHGKEVTSTGGAITVNNGIKGRVISGEIKGNTKLYKRLKGTQDVWVEIPSTETRDTVTYEYKLDSTQCIINNTGSLYPVYEPTIKGTSTGLAPTKVFSPVLPTLMAGDVLDLATRTITFANASTQVLTDKQLEAYSVYKKVILCNGVSDVYDTFEIKEDGSGVLTQNIQKYTVTGNENWINFEKNMNGISYALLNLQTKVGVKGICNRLENATNSAVEATTESFKVDSGGLYIRLFTTKANTIEEFKNTLKTEYNNGNPYIVQYVSATPIVTTIDKSIMPTIQTADKINICQVESPVAPSSFKLTLPVEINAEQNAAISALQTAVALLQQQVLTLQAFHK